MGVFREGEIAVDLIGDHEDAVFLTQVAHSAQLIRRPHPADRVVRAAQEEHRHRLDPKLGLQVVEVDFKLAIPLHQRVFHQLPAVVAHHVVERVVDRRLDEHGVAGLGQGADGGGQGEDHAGGFDQPLRLRRPAEAARKPVGQGGVVVRLGVGVAEDAVVNAPPQGGQNRIGGVEIHVRHPQGQHVRRVAILCGEVKFQTVGVPAVDGPVKIVTHGNASVLGWIGV